MGNRVAEVREDRDTKGVVGRDGTRSSSDADNWRDALSVSRGQQTWSHFGSVATFR